MSGVLCVWLSLMGCNSTSGGSGESRPGEGKGATQSVTDRDPTAAAGRGLRALKAELSEGAGGTHALSGQEISDLALGDPLPEFLIRLDSLQSYRGGDPHRLLVDLAKRTYPVTGNGDIALSLITVSETREGWHVSTISDIAGPGPAKVLKRRDGAQSTMLVRIPALMNLTFVGYSMSGKLFLRPLMDQRSLRLKRAWEYPADSLLQALARAAIRYDEDVPR